MMKLISFIGLMFAFYHIDAPWYCYLLSIGVLLDFTYTTKNGKVVKL